MAIVQCLSIWSYTKAKPIKKQETPKIKKCKIKIKLVLRLLSIDINYNNPWQWCQKFIKRANGILKV